LQIAGLLKALPLHESREAALEALREKRPAEHAAEAAS